MKRIGGILLIIILLLLLALSLSSAKIGIGRDDFIAYWSASHLLSEGENPIPDGKRLKCVSNAP